MMLIHKSSLQNTTDAVDGPVRETSSPEVLKGSPSPLGVSLSPEGDSINFALFSEHATSVTLCL